MTYAFEWDDVKDVSNFRKHGVDFATATEIFEDTFRLEDIEDSMDYGELRFRTIGRAGGGVLLVIYAERGDAIRIISARSATRREHDRYYRENAQE